MPLQGLHFTSMLINFPLAMQYYIYIYMNRKIATLSKKIEVKPLVIQIQNGDTNKLAIHFRYES